jgi:hypothetical protein
MTEQGLLTLFVFLHVLAAIIAFGPTFIFPIIGRMAATEPMHANFGVRVSEKIADRVVIPLALTMPVTGLGAIYFSHRNLADRSNWWLDIAIVVYVIAISIAHFVQKANVHHLVELSSKAPPPPAPGAPPPAGPPPAIREAVARIQRTGSLLGILIVLIVLLMVAKPQL